MQNKALPFHVVQDNDERLPATIDGREASREMRVRLPPSVVSPIALPTMFLLGASGSVFLIDGARVNAGLGGSSQPFDVAFP